VTPGGAPLRRENSSRGPPRREAPEFSPSTAPGSPQLGKQSSFSLRRERSTRRLDAPARVSPRVAPLQPPEPDDQSPNQVTPGGGALLRHSLRRERSARHFPEPQPRVVSPRVSPRVAPAGRSLRREGSSRGPPRREAPEFSPSADPGSLLRASSLRRERSTRQLSTRQLAPETPTRVSPRVAPLGAGQLAPKTTTRVSPRVVPAVQPLRREGSSRGPPRREAPEFSADPEPLGEAAATEAADEAPETAAAPPGSLRHAKSLRRERSSRKL